MYKKLIINKKIKHYGNTSYSIIRYFFIISFFGISKTSKIYQVMRNETLNEILSVFLIITLILLTCYIETI